MKKKILSFAGYNVKNILRGDLMTFLFHNEVSVQTELVIERVMLDQVIELRIICKGKFDHLGINESAVYLKQKIAVGERKGEEVQNFNLI